jgi:hypothetical protein
MELYSYGLKSMNVNFNIFPGQHNHQISTSLNHSGQFWRLEGRTNSHLLTSLKQLEDVQEEWYKIPLETVQNSYESIPRTTAAVLRAEGGPTPY